MNTVDVLLYKLWYGPFRHPFRAVTRRLLRSQNHILLGPLKGLKITIKDYASLLGVYELHIQHAISSALVAGDIFYDIGANNGYLSLLASKAVGQSGFVYAFEPLPQNIQQIKMLMSINNASNYELVPEAISNSLGEANLFVGNESTATPSLTGKKKGQSIRVRTTTLDEFAGNHRRPTLIKMDIEGAETMALEGSLRILSAVSPPDWIIEIHDADNDKAVKSLFQQHGYEFQPLLPPSPRRSRYPYHLWAYKGE